MRYFFDLLFTNNPYMSALTFVMSVLGLYFAIRPLHISRLSYFKITNKVIDLKRSDKRSNINLLYMKYNDELITNVSITKIALWNSGTEELYEERFVKERPLVLGTKAGSSARLLDCRVKFHTDSSNKIEPHLDYEKDGNDLKRKYNFSFDYIAKKDGVVLEVIHTGEADDLYMDCHIKGGEDIVEIDKQGVVIRKRSNNKLIAKAVRLFKETGLLFSDDPKNNPMSVYQGGIVFCLNTICVTGLIIIFLSFQFQAHAEIINIIETIYAEMFLLFVVVSTFCVYFAKRWWLYMIPRQLVRHLW